LARSAFRLDPNDRSRPPKADIRGAAAGRLSIPLLHRQSEVEVFFGRDQVVEVDTVLAEVDFDPIHLPIELLVGRVRGGC
jgi:hypothetical protein